MKIVILQKQDFIELVMGYKRSLLIISLLTGIPNENRTNS